MKRHCGILVVFTCFLLPCATSAGASYGNIKCKSMDSGNNAITLSGWIPLEIEGFELVLRNNDSKITLKDSDDDIYAISAFDKQVFSMVVVSKKWNEIRLYAIPKTMKSEINRNSIKSEFKAILETAPNPGYKGKSHKNKYLHDLKMKCTYDYSI
ncbi:MAG: hypothetical protein GY847_17895 [Proteobacteria bacterium]|nr:hypothetical protein [Pseudomonadota bacterium]